MDWWSTPTWRAIRRDHKQFGGSPSEDLQPRVWKRRLCNHQGWRGAGAGLASLRLVVVLWTLHGESRRARESYLKAISCPCLCLCSFLCWIFWGHYFLSMSLSMSIFMLNLLRTLFIVHVYVYVHFYVEFAEDIISCLCSFLCPFLCWIHLGKSWHSGSCSTTFQWEWCGSSFCGCSCGSASAEGTRAYSTTILDWNIAAGRSFSWNCCRGLWCRRVDRNASSSWGASKRQNQGRQECWRQDGGQEIGKAWKENKICHFSNWIWQERRWQRWPSGWNCSTQDCFCFVFYITSGWVSRNAGESTLPGTRGLYFWQF